jgi:hypothetical protein
MLSAIMLLAAAPAKIELEPPFLATAAGKVIEVEIGHAAPTFVDYDGDGLKDLLVGQFGNGRLRIYKNVGTPTAPKFNGFEWFHAGDQIAEIEAG